MFFYFLVSISYYSFVLLTIARAYIKKMLCTPTIVNQLARDLNTPGKEVAEVLNKLTPLWDEMFPAERNRLMHLLLKKVTLYEDHLDLDIRTAGVEQILEELDYEDHD